VRLVGVIGNDEPGRWLLRTLKRARIDTKGGNGSTVVFTSGSFDSLSVHDLRALQRARAQGELLVVGVNGDASTGPQRAEMLAALRFVDYVTLLPERGAAKVVRQLRPDIVI
jgi:bifunctional ADP-heptose synthase (sugar kinase/adenylyltransferase)